MQFTSSYVCISFQYLKSVLKFDCHVIERVVIILNQTTKSTIIVR